MNQPTNIAISIPPNGSNIWLEIKSIESRKSFPGINSKSDHKLKLKADPIPKSHTKKDMTSADLFLERKPSSERNATPGSNNEIEELNAEIESNIKNIGPINWPNCIWLKAESIDTNTKPGPLAGSKLNAKIIGKIASPAITAINVSSDATVAAIVAKTEKN